MQNKTFQNPTGSERSFQQGALKRSQWTLNMQEQKISIDDQIQSSQSSQLNSEIKQSNCLDNNVSKPFQPINQSLLISDSYDYKKQHNFTQELSQDNIIDVSQQFDAIKQQKQNQIYHKEDISSQKIILTQIEKKEETTVENDDCTSIYSKKILFTNFYRGDSVDAGKCLFERLGINGKYTLSQSLALFFNIHRFVKKVKNTEKNKFRNLTLPQHTYINDISSNYNYFLHNNKFRAIPTLYEQWKHKLAQFDLRKKLSDFTIGRILIGLVKKTDFIILPNSTFYTIFSVIMLIIILRIIVFVPMFLSMQQNTQKQFEGQSYLWFDIFSCFCFCLEIIFKLNTDLQLIIMKLELKYQLKGNLQALIEMIKLILFILFMAHMVACGALFIQKIELSLGNNKAWFVQYLNESWIEIYINAFYWSIVTMVTLGYGDIVPVTLNEKVYAIGVALVGCFILSYSMNQVGEILNGLAKSSTLFKEKLQQLNNYFSKNYIERDIQLKVIKYYEYLQFEDQECVNEGYKLIQQLPDQLRREIQSKLYQNLFLNKKFFSLNFSQEFLHNLSLKIQEDVLHPKQILYQKDEYPQRLYFLLNGKIEIFFNTPNKSKSIQIKKIKKKGEMMGEIEFFSNNQYEQSARSMSVTNIAYIDKEDFLQELYKHPTDYEKFKMIQDQLSFNLYQKTGFMCQSCFSFKHKFNQCPYILYQSPKEKIINQLLKSSQIKHRISFQRNKPKSVNPRSILVFIKQDAEIVQQLSLFSQNEIIVSKLDLQPVQVALKPFTSSKNCNSCTFINTQKIRQRHESKKLSIFLNEDIQQSPKKIRNKIASLINQTENMYESLPKVRKNSNFSVQAQTRGQELESLSSKAIITENDSQNKQLIQQISCQKGFNEYIQEEQDDTSIKNEQTDQNTVAQNNKQEDQLILRKHKMSYQFNEEKPIYQGQEDQKISLNLIETNKQNSNSMLSQFIIENSQKALFDQESTHQQNNFANIQYSDLNNFEKGKDYLIYFPHNNITKVLTQIQQQRRMRMQQVLKTKSKKYLPKKVCKIEPHKRRSVFKQLKIEAFSFQRQKNQQQQIRLENTTTH
ncbi:hypothetical protein ABPG74_020956 [Tetrahymena malaccensis]